MRFWSDYSRLYYHPKSLVQLSEFDVNDKLMPFETWEVGTELFEKMEREVDLVDRDLRPFVEECDSLQAFQIFTGVDDAWGGWASAWLEKLRDEYGKLSMWVWGLGEQGGNKEVPRVGDSSSRARYQTNNPQDRRLQQITNTAKSLQVLGEQSSVYVPMSTSPFKSPSYLSMDITSQWHTGALQAIGLESMTLPARLRASGGNNTNLQAMEETFNSTGKRRIAKFEMSVEDPDVLEEKATADDRQTKKTENGQAEKTKFDMDIYSHEYKAATKGRRKKEQLFGRAESSRGEWNLSDEDGRDPHDPFGQGPALQRYVAFIIFLTLDQLQ